MEAESITMGQRASGCCQCNEDSVKIQRTGLGVLWVGEHMEPGTVVCLVTAQKLRAPSHIPRAVQLLHLAIGSYSLISFAINQ